MYFRTILEELICKLLRRLMDGKHISHETIYRMIRKDKAEGGTLYKHYRHKLKHRARPVGGKRILLD